MARFHDQEDIYDNIKGLITLEDAVRKMTSAVADRLGLREKNAAVVLRGFARPNLHLSSWEIDGASTRKKAVLGSLRTALRERGLAATSASLGNTGLPIKRKVGAGKSAARIGTPLGGCGGVAPSRMNCLTMRSSSE